MGKIICAIRGGDSSRRAQERAIQLATSQETSIVFVHIIDTDFVARTATPIADAMIQEMERIGASLLSIAAERAAARGVQAETVLLRGSVAQTLENFLKDAAATTLILGSPDGPPDNNVFNLEHLEQFAERIRTAFDISVEIV